MQLLLKGKTAIVTGGTAGIGKAIALLYAEQGASVVIFGTNRERAEQALQELEKAKVNAEQKFSYKLVDVSNFKQVQKVLEEALQSFERVDVLVNNAGITKDNLLMKITEEDWDQVLDVNLKSVYNMSKALARPMSKARSGVMINISSVIGLTGNAGQTNYAASKAGMIGFTKSLAKELARRGIRVNAIAPGYIETPMTDKMSDDMKEGILSSIPMHRIGTPKEIAHAALFLASDLSSYVTGQVLTVDGGMVM